jgi:chromosomal replication initiator protein
MFDQFVVGSSNQFACAAAIAVAERPGGDHNPLFLHGPVGLGKTHLVNAIGHELARSGKGRKLLFAPADLLLTELIFALRHDCIGGFRERMRQVEVLIVDDVHFLAGRERAQEEFYHIFNMLDAEGHQIVLTSDKAPRDLTGLQDSLRSRFESRLIAEIEPPELQTRIAIIEKKAAALKVALDPQAAAFIAGKVSSNVRELEGCLNRLAALASLTQIPITPDLARESLCDFIPGAEITPAIVTILYHVSNIFHIPLADLRSKKRTQHLAFCRQVAMYLCRRLTGCSFPVIGANFDRDHSTVMYACNLIARRVKNDGAFRRSIEKIERDVKILYSRVLP